MPGQSGYGKRLRAASCLLTSMVRILARDTTWKDTVARALHAIASLLKELPRSEAGSAVASSLGVSAAGRRIGVT